MMGATAENSTESPEERMRMLAVRLWIFGEEHLLPKLQNEVMAELHKSFSFRYPTVEATKEVYKGSPSGSVLRKRILVGVLEEWKEGGSTANIEGGEDFDGLGGVPGFLADFVVGTWEILDGVGEASPDRIDVQAYLINED